MTFTAEQIAAYVGGTIEGDAQTAVTTFAKIEEGVPGSLSFLANPKYEHYIYATKSSIVLVDKDFQPREPIAATLIRVDNAYAAVASLMTLYQSAQTRKTGVRPFASVAETATVNDDCYVGPYAVIGDNAVVGRGSSIYAHTVVGDGVTVGEGCVLYPNVTVYDGCKIGARVVIHAGAVIGADGFGFAPTETGYDKIPQLGIVVIEDDVEIGANTCVDRSTMGATIIHKGVKLDNLVQIAHNVEVGCHTVMSSQAGVAGSAKVGEWCMLGGQVGIAGHISIGDRTNVGAQSGVPGGNLARRGGATLMGYPAIDHRTWARQSAALKQLPDLAGEVAALRREIEELKQRT